MKQKNDINPLKTKPRVIFYSGYKSYEIPRSIIIEKNEHIIKKIREQKRIMDQQTGETFQQFICETENKTYSIKIPESRKTYKVEVYEEKGK